SRLTVRWPMLRRSRDPESSGPVRVNSEAVVTDNDVDLSLSMTETLMERNLSVLSVTFQVLRPVTFSP
ncbi:hypothetical protein KHP62_21920, partial [Rhodobacteraceae bacterium NNCM2]|nr:hypothetical protein [Coraliihabitans acroporae]